MHEGGGVKRARVHAGMRRSLGLESVAGDDLDGAVRPPRCDESPVAVEAAGDDVADMQGLHSRLEARGE